MRVQATSYTSGRVQATPYTSGSVQHSSYTSGSVQSTPYTSGIEIKKERKGLFGWIRRFYDWVIGKSSHPWALPFLSLVAFSESVFFPVPPDVMLIPMCLGNRYRSMWYATVCTLSSVIGGVAGYGVGYLFYDVVGQKIITFYHMQDAFLRLQDYFNVYGVWFVLVAAFTPIPYKVFCISSGLFHMSLAPFVMASVLGRGGRFFGVSILIYLFGQTIQTWIDRYFNWLTVIFVLLLVGCFVILKYT